MPHLSICSDEPITRYRTGQNETYLHETEYAVEYHHFSTDEIPRSNPFNYENRRNSAAPLGAIISEDFKKAAREAVKGRPEDEWRQCHLNQRLAEKNIEHTVSPALTANSLRRSMKSCRPRYIILYNSANVTAPPTAITRSAAKPVFSTPPVYVADGALSVPVTLALPFPPTTTKFVGHVPLL